MQTLRRETNKGITLKSRLRMDTQGGRGHACTRLTRAPGQLLFPPSGPWNEGPISQVETRRSFHVPSSGHARTSSTRPRFRQDSPDGTLPFYLLLPATSRDNSCSDTGFLSLSLSLSSDSYLLVVKWIGSELIYHCIRAACPSIY